jgi:hypothetical protein
MWHNLDEGVVGGWHSKQQQQHCVAELADPKEGTAGQRTPGIHRKKRGEREGGEPMGQIQSRNTITPDETD